ncbi:MAG: hypothetical protein SWX82_03065 [Cyanobacteriota bacterium]|nr:hypothetical protein [Cyanobacteriota bacterium]
MIDNCSGYLFYNSLFLLTTPPLPHSPTPLLLKKTFSANPT